MPSLSAMMTPLARSTARTANRLRTWAPLIQRATYAESVAVETLGGLSVLVTWTGGSLRVPIDPTAARDPSRPCSAAREVIAAVLEARGISAETIEAS